MQHWMNSSFTQTFQKVQLYTELAYFMLALRKEVRENKLAKTNACERNTLLSWSWPLIAQFAGVYVSNTTCWLRATLGKAIRGILKPWRYYWNLHLHFWSYSCISVFEMLGLAHAAAAQLAFHLHIKARRKNTFSTINRYKNTLRIFVHRQIQLRNSGCSQALNQHLKTDLWN